MANFDLNREKVLFPKRKTILFISPLKPGEYEFFGEYHPHTAKGKIVVKEANNAN
jgi:plastocyanin